jgi:hypothetical protein
VLLLLVLLLLLRAIAVLTSVLLIHCGFVGGEVGCSPNKGKVIERHSG